MQQQPVRKFCVVAPHGEQGGGAVIMETTANGEIAALPPNQTRLARQMHISSCIALLKNAAKDDIHEENGSPGKKVQFYTGSVSGK